MLPTSLDAITFQDVFRLLRQRQSGNSNQASNQTQSDKENVQNNSIIKSADPNRNTTSNPSLSGQLQTLLLLGLLNKNFETSDYQSNKIPTSTNSLFAFQNKSTEKPLSTLETPNKEATSHKAFQRSASVKSFDDLSLPVKQSSELREKLSLSRKINTEDINKGTDLSVLDPRSKKISRKTNQCGHPERAHYAKNMCNQCYHKHGRTKKPWRCDHEKLYAHGLCQNCYINAYNKKRSLKQKEEKAESVSISEENDMSEPPQPSSVNTKEEMSVEDNKPIQEEESSPINQEESK